MSYTIYRGKHRVSKFPVKIWIGPVPLLRYSVRFDDSWKQSWPGDDTNDVSKLIGIGCFNLWWCVKMNVVRFVRSIFTKDKYSFAAPHHWKSSRIGIDYNETLDVMDVYEYVYHKGVRFFRKVCEFQFYATYHIEIDKRPDETLISISNTTDNHLVSISSHHWKGISYLLRPYFGGDNPARRDTNVNLKML
jgi:hypothetical protein